jgi:4-hydroxybutyryl-CoA dehydratase / vinylacetyl-CoA-Delta-isomerase
VPDSAVSISSQTAPVQPLVTGQDYIASLRGRGLRVYFMGEKLEEPVDHPVVRPSVNAVARTYDLAVEHPELATGRERDAPRFQQRRTLLPDGLP